MDFADRLASSLQRVRGFNRWNAADPDAPVPGSVWGDLNAPLITSYINTDFVEKPRPGYVLHRQPSGLSVAMVMIRC